MWSNKLESKKHDVYGGILHKLLITVSMMAPDVLLVVYYTNSVCFASRLYVYLGPAFHWFVGHAAVFGITYISMWTASPSLDKLLFVM